MVAPITLTLHTMLRITSGEFRNRRIEVPETGDVRPMLEKPRQAIFSILGQDIAEGELVIDCFAGTGVLGLEALSRGASHALFYDINRDHIEALEALVERIRCAERCTIRRTNVMRAISTGALLSLPVNGPAKLIFLDPPHAMSDELDGEFYRWFEGLGDTKAVGPRTIVVFGHHAELEPPLEVGKFKRFDHRAYGKVAVSMYEVAGAVEGKE